MGKQATARQLEDNEARAVVHNLRVSAQKLNLVAETMRGLDAAKAIASLTFSKRRIAGAVHRALTPRGVKLLQANGAGAGQSVFHFHFHVMPRRPGDDVPLNWAPKPGDRAEIAAVAEKIRAELK